MNASWFLYWRLMSCSMRRYALLLDLLLMVFGCFNPSICCCYGSKTRSNNWLNDSQILRVPAYLLLLLFLLLQLSVQLSDKHMHIDSKYSRFYWVSWLNSFDSNSNSSSMLTLGSISIRSSSSGCITLEASKTRIIIVLDARMWKKISETTLSDSLLSMLVVSESN